MIESFCITGALLKLNLPSFGEEKTNEVAPQITQHSKILKDKDISTKKYFKYINKGKGKIKF